ncbi:uncharacterized protein LOC117120471 [Anneissia japonica]|uniref:uncharacterized protein LOC117120471 n=1 Tax=Anneissia japonica TaxID=1529436 RepID=UPI001425746D|nr:uncharacterized protein LOC117120471 [Anneissia japonica]
MVGYGAASYLRQKDAKGNTSCMLVMAKSRLAPTKARLDTIIRDELKGVQIDRSVFWTDSTCVLKYLQNKDARYHTFVANRFSTILNTTHEDQWQHVASQHNPADLASRGVEHILLVDNQTWLQGPEFLKNDKEKWPKFSHNYIIDQNDPEVKNVNAAVASFDTRKIFVKL